MLFLVSRCSVLPVFAGVRRFGTTTSADFCEHDSSHLDRPAFRASPTHGYASQISPNKSVNCPCPSSPSTSAPCFRFGFALACTLAWSRRPRMNFLFVAWQVLAMFAGAFLRKRLPSHGWSPFRSCLRLVSVSYELFIWYPDSLRNTGTKRRGLILKRTHPINSHPCRAYMHRSGGPRGF